MALIDNPISTGIALFKDLIDRFIPDKNQAAAAKDALDQLRANNDAAQELAAAGIVRAEAGSQFFLTAAWRPITMLVFVGLIVCRMFGWTSSHVTQDEYILLWHLVEVGLGGYVIGRSAEKVLPNVVAAIKGAVSSQ